MTFTLILVFPSFTTWLRMAIFKHLLGGGGPTRAVHRQCSGGGREHCTIGVECSHPSSAESRMPQGGILVTLLWRDLSVSLDIALNQATQMTLPSAPSRQTDTDRWPEEEYRSEACGIYFVTLFCFRIQAGVFRPHGLKIKYWNVGAPAGVALFSVVVALDVKLCL